MGRQLQVVIIDDKHFDSTNALDLLRNYVNLRVVTGTSDAIRELKAIASVRDEIVDVILCDVNMQFDNDATSFPLAVGHSTHSIKPVFKLSDVSSNRFELEGQARALESDDFKPYGPILALPFARSFRNGGVIRPISAYWRDTNLLNVGSHDQNGVLNGYVFIALSLIWAQVDFDPSGTKSDTDMFSVRFSKMYRDVHTHSLSDTISDQFFEAVHERRQQLFTRALMISGIDKLTLDTIDGGVAEVVVWDYDNKPDILNVKSLFADYHYRSLFVRDSIEADLDQLAEALEGELSRFRRVLKLSEEKIFHLCSSFIRISAEKRENKEPKFREIYRAAYDVVIISGEQAVPFADGPADLPSSIRRYLLLFAQLYYLAKGTAKGTFEDHWSGGTNTLICEMLGLDTGEHKLKEFIYGQRKPLEMKDSFRKMDLPHDSADFTGWRPFNIIDPVCRKVMGPNGKKLKLPVNDAEWQWTDLDRKMAQAFWNLCKEGGRKLPHGLGQKD